MEQVKLLYCNINSYIHKKPIISHYIEENNIDCTLFVETKTKENANVSYKDWHYIHKHGNIVNNNTRGGCLVQAKRLINLGKANPPSMNNPLNDVLHFTMPFKNSKLHVFLTYIHPTSHIEDNLFIKASLCEYAIIIGDVNVNAQKGRQIQNFLQNSNFDKIVTPPTFIMANNPSSTPDIMLVSSNLKNNIIKIELIPDLCSDHLAIEVTVDPNITPIRSEVEPKYNFEKCDIGKVNTELMEFVYHNGEISQNNISEFQNVLSTSIKNNSPQYKTKYYCQKLPPFIISLIKQKRKLYREIKQFENPEIKRNFNELNKHIHKLIQQFRTSKWLEVCQEINKEQGRNYWQKIKKLSRYKKHNVMPQIEENNKCYTTDKEKTEIFAEHFKNIYKETENDEFDVHHYNYVKRWHDNLLINRQQQLGNIKPITEEEYYNVLHNGKNTAPGYDNIPRKILKKLAPEIHMHIIKILNFCLIHTYYPNEWKTGIIITILKPNQDSSKTNSYRPITLLPVIGKIFEKILKGRLESDLGEIIPNYQFGFKCRTSTIHPLTILVSNIQTSGIEGYKSAAIFLDIRKAFDSTWHLGLLYKLHQINCPTYLIILVEEFLNNRTLYVKINGTLSEKFTASQGVPQGSPLSPFLYNIYCHDIYNHNTPNHVIPNPNSYMLQFADDTAIVEHHKSLQSCIQNIQRKTNETIEWMMKWRITPNPTKSKLVIFNHQIKHNSPKITVQNKIIEPSAHTEYLGVKLDNKLNFNLHTQVTKSKAIARARHFRGLTYKNEGINITNSTKIYTAICRPLLEYAGILFLNCKTPAKNNIEIAERSSLRTITKLRHPNNPIHNPSNILLYEKTKLVPILERIDVLSSNFASNSHNINIISPLLKKRNVTMERKRRHPLQTLEEIITEKHENAR